jgi:hypothetical protein
MFPLRLVPSRGKGLGVSSASFIPAGALVCPFEGELTTVRRDEHETEDAHFYALALDKGVVVDPSRAGNVARFINHSCEPSLGRVLVTWEGLAVPKVFLFALEDISLRQSSRGAIGGRARCRRALTASAAGAQEASAHRGVSISRSINSSLINSSGFSV